MNDINESTGISLKLLLGTVAAVLGPIVGAFLWVSVNVAEIKTTLQGMAALQMRAAADLATIDTRLSVHVLDDNQKWQDIDRRLNVIEKTGSEKAHELEKRLNELDILFRVHAAPAKLPPP